jgi:hypothetical protein
MLHKERMNMLKGLSYDDFVRQAGYTDMDQAGKDYVKYTDNLTKGIDPAYDRMLQERVAMEYYKRLLGEAEARAVQDRQMMTPSQRMETPPPASYDVPQEDLIVKPPREYADGGPVHFSDNPDVMQLEMAGGGLVKGIKAAAKAVKGTQEVLPKVEREENLQKFLGNSRIRERLYHATPKDFKQFKPGGNDPTMSGPAIWLTPDATKQPAAHNISSRSQEFREGVNVMPVYAQARSPLLLDDKLSIELAREVFADGSREFPDLISQKTIDELKSSGYDSIIHADPYGNRDGEQEILMFDPNRIKSAIGNRGTYDIEDPDITKAEGGAVRMQAGGLVRGIKALKAAKEPAQAPMKASEALGRIEGRPLVITQSDRTKVGGGFLGGPGFSSLQLTEPEYRAAEAVWGVKTPGVAKMILGGGKKAGPDPVYTTFIGTPNQHQSNQMVFDKLYGDFKKSAKKGGLEPELQEKINYRLANAVDKDGRPIFPPDVNILDKNFKDLATTFDQRAVTSSLIGGLGVGGKKGQIVDYDKIIRNTTDPALLDAPSGALGNRLFTLSGGIIDRPDLHPAFPTILQGEDLGVSFDPVVRDLVMKDFIEKTMREKGRTPGYMDYTRGHPPSQLITEDILTEMQKLGLKAGGEVKAPAAQIDGEKFVLAAQKYGLGDDMSTLNKMVSLVNRGATVEEAARTLSGGVRKAAGGEITADDLILEERKL